MTEKKFQRKLEKIKKQGERYKQEYELKESYAKYLPDKKKRKVSNIMLVIIVIAIVGYTAASFILQHQIGVEVSPTLTTVWFSFWTVEILALTAIKTSKVKHEHEHFDSSEFDCEITIPDEEMYEETYDEQEV